MAEDLELKAIKTIMELLKPLDETGRSRVLEYVLKRLDMTAFQAEPAIVAEQVSVGSSAFSGGPVKDIRTFTAENSRVRLTKWLL
jgi:hypothetical protein